MGHRCHMEALEGAIALAREEHSAIYNSSPKGRGTPNPLPIDRLLMSQLEILQLHSVTAVLGLAYSCGCCEHHLSLSPQKPYATIPSQRQK